MKQSLSEVLGSSGKFIEEGSKEKENEEGKN